MAYLIENLDAMLGGPRDDRNDIDLKEAIRLVACMMNISNVATAARGQAVAGVGFGNELLAEQFLEMVVIEIISDIVWFHVAVAQHVGVFQPGDDVVLDYRQLHALYCRGEKPVRQALAVPGVLLMVAVNGEGVYSVRHMSEYSPDIHQRLEYQAAREADLVELRERLLDFADLWPATRVVEPKRIVTQAWSDYSVKLESIPGEAVHIRHGVELAYEVARDNGDERYVVMVSNQVKRHLHEFDELDGQVFVGSNLMPEPQARHYTLSFEGKTATATVSSWDLCEGQETVADMTRYDVQELMGILKEHQLSEDDVFKYTDHE